MVSYIDVYVYRAVKCLRPTIPKTVLRSEEDHFKMLF